MIFDGIIILILLYCMIRGFKRGFSKSFFVAIGWVVSLCGAFMATPVAKTYILQKTDWFEQFIPEEPVATTIPNIISEYILEATSDLIFTLLVFFGCFIVIKLVMWVIISLATLGDKKSFTSFVDGFFGALFGLLKGAILVFVFVAMIYPLTDVLIPSMADIIENLMDGSYIVKYLYENDPIYFLLKGFIS